MLSLKTCINATRTLYTRVSDDSDKPLDANAHPRNIVSCPRIYSELFCLFRKEVRTPSTARDQPTYYDVIAWRKQEAAVLIIIVFVGFLRNPYRQQP